MTVATARYEGVETFQQLRAHIQPFVGNRLTLDPVDPAAIKADNDLRAAWAALAVLTYADRTFGGAEGEEFETVIGDLLADLRHLCDALDLDYGDCDDKGYRHYRPELAGGS